MKKLLLLLTVTCGSFMSFAQHNVTIEASQNITNFKFTNSAGESVDGYKPNYSGGYALGYRYRMDNGLFFPVKVECVQEVQRTFMTTPTTCGT